VLNDLQSEFGTAPAADGGEGKMWHSCFSLSCLYSETEQVPLVTMSHPSSRTVAPPPCLLYIKDLQEEDKSLGWELVED
jgi:hypothetical protein